MGTKHINSLTRFLLTQLLYTSLCIAANHELRKGFTTSPDPSVFLFRPLLTDSTGKFSLGLLRVDSAQLALAIVHAPSSEPLWTANLTKPARWTNMTRVSFNGSLVISDPQTGAFWSTFTNGDRVFLSSSSNLQVQKLDKSNSVLWQSFDHPTNTFVENQIFTSAMALVSSNGLYSMRLGKDFMGLYTNHRPDLGRIYLKHRALQARAEIYEGGGPIYLVLKQEGYLGMYQNGTEPVDVQPFDTFNTPKTQSSIRLVRVEEDGNLKGYLWSGSTWVLDYQAITERCELPSACGPWGLCSPGKNCSCIDNRTNFKSGRCGPLRSDSGDFCGLEKKFKVLRRNGLDFPYKELIGYVKMGSWAQCEGKCENDCKCWGVVYNNLSGLCYTIDYPISIVNVGEESQLSYFKVREGARK